MSWIELGWCGVAWCVVVWRGVWWDVVFLDAASALDLVFGKRRQLRIILVVISLDVIMDNLHMQMRVLAYTTHIVLFAILIESH